MTSVRIAQSGSHRKQSWAVLGRRAAEWSGDITGAQGGHLFHCEMWEKSSHFLRWLQGKQCPQRRPRFPLYEEREETIQTLRKGRFCQYRQFLGVSRGGGEWEIMSGNGMYRTIWNEMQEITSDLGSWASCVTGINQGKGNHDNQ